MVRDAGGQGFDFVVHLRQGRCISFGQLLHAAGQRPRYPIQLALHFRRQLRQPLIIDGQRLDLVLAQLWVLGEHLLEEEAAAEKKGKDLQKELDKKVFAKYPKLSEDEIKTLAVDDKWLAKLR